MESYELLLTQGGNEGREERGSLAIRIGGGGGGGGDMFRISIPGENPLNVHEIS
jgi:hypothetical protein